MISIFRKKVISLILLIAVSLFLPGCWNYRELNQIGIVSAMGIDINEQGKIKLTVQVINPQASTTKGQTQKKAVRIESSEGETLFDAVRNLMMKSGDRLFYPHMSVIVFGEDLGRKGLLPVLDFLGRDPEIRLLTWVLITEGKAEEIIRAPSNEALISALHLKSLVEDYKSFSKTTPANLLNLFTMLYDEGVEPVLGKVQFVEEKGEPTFLMEGGAAFREDKLIAWLNGGEARGYLWIEDEIKSGIITATKDDTKISFEIIRGRTKVKPILDEGNLRFVIEVDASCNLGERMDHAETTTKEEFDELTKILNQAIIREIQVIVDKAQKELKADILGFGLNAMKKYPDYWQEHKDGWEEIFPNLDVEILVEGKINARGTIR